MRPATYLIVVLYLQLPFYSLKDDPVIFSGKIMLSTRRAALEIPIPLT